MTVSHWRRSPSPERVAADVVVIGAGIAGVSAALSLQRRGASVCIVERHTLASGASSRNAGFLMRGCADHYAQACRLYGRERARDLWRLTEANIAAVIGEGADTLPSFRRVPSCLLALDEPQEQELAASCEMLREDGFDAAWITSGDDSAWASGRCRAGLVNPGDASVNSWELMKLLAGKLTRPVVENQEVFEIRPSPSGVVVRTADHEFVAGHVLVCTNAYAPLLLPGFDRLVTPRRGQMIAIRYPEATRVRVSHSYYFNHGSEYFRQTPDGAIVFGGCRTYHADREVGYEDRTTPWVQDDIERWVRDLLGGGYQVTARWAGTMGFSPDGLPIVGPASGIDDRHRVWFCGGFTGHGMSMGYKTAELAVAAMLTGQANPFDIARFMT
jgi:glycine/D-amino acid oxidase-like deaminating enzyme